MILCFFLRCLWDKRGFCLSQDVGKCLLTAYSRSCTKIFRIPVQKLHRFWVSIFHFLSPNQLFMKGGGRTIAVPAPYPRVSSTRQQAMQGSAISERETRQSTGQFFAQGRFLWRCPDQFAKRNVYLKIVRGILGPPAVQVQYKRRTSKCQSHQSRSLVAYLITGIVPYVVIKTRI